MAWTNQWRKFGGILKKLVQECLEELLQGSLLNTRAGVPRVECRDVEPMAVCPSSKERLECLPFGSHKVFNQSRLP